jgi:nucleoside phosphorylase
MTANLVVTPLQEEYDNLYQSLCALGLSTHAAKIGKLNVDLFPALNITLVEQIQRLNLSYADFQVHFGIMAGGDEDVIDAARGAELRGLHQALAVAWEGVGGARASAFSGVPYLEIRGATDTANHEAPVVFEVNLKIVMKNIALLLYRWLSS